jgi:siroheme synthase-like protein
MPGYPIELDLRGRKVLVVGLGPVGRRKAKGLADAGARVLAVDPAADVPGLARGATSPDGEAGAIEVRAECYRAEHLEGAVLAFAAATPEVNRRMLADARRAGVWACSASDPDAGDFRVPAVRRDGPLTVTVATSGASPALARALCERAARALGPAAAGLAALLAELRPRVLARLDGPDARRRLMADWADPRWLDLWERDGPEAVRRALGRAIDEAADHP